MNKNPEKFVTITNDAPVSTDRACTPISLPIPVVLIQDDREQLQWIDEPMDYSSASRLQALASMSGMLTRVITVELILPAAEDLCIVSSDLDETFAKPVRVKLKTPTQR